MLQQIRRDVRGANLATFFVDIARILAPSAISHREPATAWVSCQKRIEHFVHAPMPPSVNCVFPKPCIGAHALFRIGHILGQMFALVAVAQLDEIYLNNVHFLRGIIFIPTTGTDSVSRAIILAERSLRSTRDFDFPEQRTSLGQNGDVLECEQFMGQRPVIAQMSQAIREKPEEVVPRKNVNDVFEECA